MKHKMKIVCTYKHHSYITLHHMILNYAYECLNVGQTAMKQDIQAPNKM